MKRKERRRKRDKNITHLHFRQTRRHDAGVADLEKVTDYVEEQEIASSAIGDALNLVGETAMRDEQVIMFCLF